MKMKYLECDCCGFLAVVHENGSHDIDCPYCEKVQCDHGGRFDVIDAERFIKLADLKQ